ncbi:MAG TPA: hypothetical protein VJI67_02590, partial [archaeon]|nr:hypothetical protein [archaeon]
FKVMRITADVNSVTGTSGDSLSTKNALVDVNVGDFNLAVTEADISFSANPASNGQAIEVTAVIRNSSVISDANDVNVAFYKSSVSASNLLGHTTLQVAKQSNASAVLAWTVTESSDVNVVVQIDPVNDLNDYNPGDNLAGKVLTILSTGCRAPASGTWNVQEADVCDKNGIDLNGPVATSSAGGMTMLDSNWVFRQANDGNFFVKAAGTNPFKMRGSRVDVNAGSSFRFDFNIESGTDNNLDSANLSTARIYLKTETRTWAYSTDLNNLHLLGTADLNCPNITKHCTLKGLLDVNGSTTVAVISGYVRTSSLPLESVFFDTGAKLVRFFPITVKNQNDSGVSGADINVFNSVGELMWSCAACTDSSGNGLARVDFNKGTKDQNFVVHVRKQGLFFADTNYMFKDVNVTVVSNAPLEFVLSPAGSLPFADAGNDQVVRTGGSDANVTLDPSNSFDPDNDNGTT